MARDKGSTEEADSQLEVHARDSAGGIRAAETPLSQLEGLLTPNHLFYIIHHYDTPPPIDRGAWALRVEGKVARRLELTYEDLRQMPSRTQMAMVECAGTSRKYLSPPTIGTQLGDGSISAAEWTGVPLSSVLDHAGLLPSARDVLVEGVDTGTAQPENVTTVFAKGVPLEKALHVDTLLAWAMNGQPLTHVHGAPLRLIVPGWYGVWWVKWIQRIEVLGQPFNGFWQGQRYVYEGPDEAEPSLVSRQLVKAVVTRPEEGATERRGPVQICGYAWSGSGAVTHVEVSTDAGKTWSAARLLAPQLPWMWRRWDYIWDAELEGEAMLMARATDELGQTQPLAQSWNRLGYGNNAVQPRRVTIV